MRSFAVLAIAAGLVAAQTTSIIISDGITTTIALPAFPDLTASATVTASVPEATVTISAGTETVTGGVTTTTIGIPVPSQSVSEPVVTMPTFTDTIGTTLFTSATFYTSSPNATTTGPVTVPTAAADKVSLKRSAIGLVAFGVASLFLF